jgi:hypothetical protein
MVAIEVAVSRRPKLIGTYTPPPVRKGERVSCLYRDCECVVTGFHDGRIVWPRVRARERRGGSGLWVNQEMVRAIRTESAAALIYWFGVSSKVVWNWRKTFGVKGKFGTPGSDRAHQVASLEGARSIKKKVWTPRELLRKSKAAKGVGLKPGPRWTPENGGWTPEEVALLGTDHDEVVGERIGRTADAVRCKRKMLRIPTFRDRRYRGH